MPSSFLDRVTDFERGTISPERVCEALRVLMAHPAELAHVHCDTLARRPDSPLVQERLSVVVRIVAVAGELTGDAGRAVVWFRHQPLAGLDGRTAEELVAAGQADAVLAYLVGDAARRHLRVTRARIAAY